MIGKLWQDLFLRRVGDKNLIEVVQQRMEKGEIGIGDCE